MPKDEPVMDRLTGQLYHLPAIIGNLGISVANAQKALNSDYIRNIEVLMEMIEKILGSQPDTADDKVTLVKELLKQLAPSRYQFTETTLEFYADLAERKSKHLQAAVGGGFAGITLSAGYAKAFGYDYRAAARVRAILHALPANDDTMQALITQAGQFKMDGSKLPAKYQVEAEIFNGLVAITNALTDPEARQGSEGTGGGRDRIVVDAGATNRSRSSGVHRRATSVHCRRTDLSTRTTGTCQYLGTISSRSWTKSTIN